MTQDVVCKCEGVFAQQASERYVDLCTVADLNGECQQHRVNSRSPGPVTDEELIARWVSNPHVNKDLPFQLSESLFNDVFTIGGSALRLLDGWRQEAERVHVSGEADSERRRQDGATQRIYIGVVHISVLMLRALQLNELQVPSRVRVYDTALEHVPKHADIMVYHDDLKGDSKQAREKRKKIKVEMLALAAANGFYLSPKLDPQDERVKNIGLTIHL